MKDTNLLLYMGKLNESDKQWLTYILERHKKEKVCLELSSYKKAVGAVQVFGWSNYRQPSLVDDAERLLNKLGASLYYRSLDVTAKLETL